MDVLCGTTIEADNQLCTAWNKAIRKVCISKMRHIFINHKKPRYYRYVYVKTGSMNGFIVVCSMYLLCYQIINQSGNALLASH